MQFEPQRHRDTEKTRGGTTQTFKDNRGTICALATPIPSSSLCLCASVVKSRSYNIANGLTAGLILHPLMKVCSGRWRAIHPGSALLAGMCLAYYVFGKLH